MAPFADPHLQEKLNAFIAQHRWDYAVYDGLHAAATSYQKGRYVQPPSFGAVIYRAHNFETALWEQNASPVSRLQRLNWIKRGGALLISKQVKNFESSLALTSQGVATVSAEDAESFKQIKYKINAFSVPIGQDFDSQLSPILPIADSNIPLLFIGRMDWPPNAEGLKWFLNSVWPKAIQQRPNLVLTIAGSGNSNWLRSYAHLPRLKLLGRVAHVHPVYNACWATIIPIRYGSGTRVKAIESCRLGRVCISTQAGVEGLGFTAGAQYIQAESAEDWIQALTKVDYPTCKTMGHQAFLFINKNYNGTTLAEKFSRLCFGTKPGSNHS
jgi:hypothetical protein